LDENAPELIETAEEKAEKMDATVDHRKWHKIDSLLRKANSKQI
jgi:hypothetical protein